jgi:superoxide dismutase
MENPKLYALSKLPYENKALVPYISEEQRTLQSTTRPI